MRDTIIYGEKPPGINSCSWCALDRFAGIDRHGRFSISANRDSYYITGVSVLDFTLMVYKDSREHRAFTNMLDTNQTDEALDHYASRLVFARVEPKDLMQRIEWKMQEAFEAGSRARAEIIREALGVR
jgi:hypothetical protein